MKSRSENEVDALITGRIRNNYPPVIVQNQELMIAEGLHPKRLEKLDKDKLPNPQIKRSRIVKN